MSNDVEPRKMRLSFAGDDEILNDWLDAQRFPAASLTMLVHRYVEAAGITDPHNISGLTGYKVDRLPLRNPAVPNPPVMLEKPSQKKTPTVSKKSRRKGVVKKREVELQPMESGVESRPAPIRKPSINDVMGDFHRFTTHERSVDTVVTEESEPTPKRSVDIAVTEEVKQSEGSVAKPASLKLKNATMHEANRLDFSMFL